MADLRQGVGKENQAGSAVTKCARDSDGGNPAAFGPIGHGGTERMLIYPAMLWMLTFGGYLMAAPHREPSD